MPDITIRISDEEKKIITRRAKKNMFTLREQLEDIIRTSAIRTKSSKKISRIKVDDKLVSIFSRDARGSGKRKKKVNSNKSKKKGKR